MEEIEETVEISAEEEQSIAQQTNDLVTSIVGMVHELSEKGVFPKLPDDNMYQIDGTAREKIDKTSEAAKAAHNRFDENKNMPQLSWYKIPQKIKQQKQKEENQREIINDLITAGENNAEASQLLFNQIIQLSTYSRKLLALGLGGIACNRIVVREVRARLKHASEKELDKLAQQELLYVLTELEKQNALELKIDEAIEELSKKANANELVELKESAKNQSYELAKLKENLFEICDKLNNKANVINEELTQQKENINQSQAKIKEELSKKTNTCDFSAYKVEINIKLKHLWIAYGITTATLVAGLIASFLI